MTVNVALLGYGYEGIRDTMAFSRPRALACYDVLRALEAP